MNAQNFQYPHLMAKAIFESVKLVAPDDYALAKKSIQEILLKIPEKVIDDPTFQRPVSPFLNFLVEEEIIFPPMGITNKKQYLEGVSKLIDAVFDFAVVNYGNLDDQLISNLILLYVPRFAAPLSKMRYRQTNLWDRLTPLVGQSIIDRTITENILEEAEVKKNENKILSKSKSYDNQKNKKS